MEKHVNGLEKFVLLKYGEWLKVFQIQQSIKISMVFFTKIEKKFYHLCGSTHTHTQLNSENNLKKEES